MVNDIEKDRGQVASMLNLFKPNQIFESVLDITPKWLKDRDIDGLIIDLDNTTIPWGEWDFRLELHEWTRSMHRAGVKLCILSNGRRRRVSILAQKLQMPYIYGKRKPRKSAFLRAMSMLNTPLHRTAVIGDQLFTDVLGGNRLGLLTILVSPLSEKEFFGTKVMRYLEKVVFKKLDQEHLRQGIKRQRNGHNG